MRGILLALTVMVVLGTGLAPGKVAQGDEGYAGGGARPVWVFDARVVRVVTSTVAITESPGAWEPDRGATTGAAWPEILAALKERGATTLLLDQRVTTVVDRPAQAVQKSDRFLEQFQSRDFSNERWGASTLTTGTTVEVTPTAEGLLSYRINAMWAIPSDATDRAAARPRTCNASWQGAHPAIDGTTLVLSYREQVGAIAPRGVEVYVLLSGRRVE